MPGSSLTTHVLDTTSGKPAAGMDIELSRFGKNGERRVIKTTRTNSDGRTDEPLLSEDEFEEGEYEIVFFVGEYFAGSAGGLEVSGLPFLGRVPVRFGVSDARAHYHVPLLVSPFSYSTYRGS